MLLQKILLKNFKICNREPRMCYTVFKHYLKELLTMWNKDKLAMKNIQI